MGKEGHKPSERVSTKEAARAIGCAEQYLRERMKDKGENHWDLGMAVKPGRGRQNCSYYIFRSKLDAFLGKGLQGQAD